MQRKIIARLGAASAVAGATAMVLAPSAFAGGNGNTTNNTNLIPAKSVTASPGPGPILVGPLPAPGTPGLPGNVKVSASCPSSLFNNPNVGFTFTDGNAHLYGDAVTGTIGVGTGGANAEGDAILSVDGAPIATGFLHAWVGFNTNPNNTNPGSVVAGSNNQYVFAQTIAFTGTTPTGQSISINANPGGTISASGNANGWGQLTVDCSS